MNCQYSHDLNDKLTILKFLLTTLTWMSSKHAPIFYLLLWSDRQTSPSSLKEKSTQLAPVLLHKSECYAITCDVAVFMLSLTRLSFFVFFLSMFWFSFPCKSSETCFTSRHKSFCFDHDPLKLSIGCRPVFAVLVL